MDVIHEILSKISFGGVRLMSTFDMHLSTESLDHLDFSPYQTEIIFNKLLPYADELEEEADALLAKIKFNFGRCVMMRDIDPGCVYWSNVINMYIELYGMRFTKEEHITLIKLSYELLTIPNLQPSLVDTFAKLLYSLLKKKEILSPDELELHWEPLYKLCVPVLRCRFIQINSLCRYPLTLDRTLESLVKSAKTYFPPTATQEILDELRPFLCPLDPKHMMMAFRLLHWFLPVQYSKIEYHTMGHELWFHEFMKLWEVCHNLYSLQCDLMQLLAKLASNNIGYIDWNPYIPFIFTNFIRILNLPIYYKKTGLTSNHTIKMSAVGEWIASALGDHSNAQTYLDKFLKTVETYFYPANYGVWLKRLEELYIQIIYHVLLRLHRERHAKKSWRIQTPKSHRLTDANIDAFVNSVMPIMKIGAFNDRCSKNFCYALQYLTMMRPNLVIPIVLEKLYPSADTDIEPHKLITVMNCMVSVSRTLVQGPRYFSKDYAYSEGPLHVLPLLFASLPGMDPNDPAKCIATTKLISAYIMLIAVVDCSNSRAEISEDEREICAETARFEDFILQFMDKNFILIESNSLEMVGLESLSSDDGEGVLSRMVENTSQNAFKSLLLQASESIFITALHKLRSYIMENILETKIAGQMLAGMCKAFSQVNAPVALKALIPSITEKIFNFIGDGEDIIEEENLDKQLLYMLLLLQKLMETMGDALLPHMDVIVKVLDTVTKLKNLEGNQLGCTMLKNVLESLCVVKPVRIDKNLNDPEYPYWKDWGESTDVKSTNIIWYVPGEQEMAVAESSFTRYFIPALKSIEDYNITKDLSRHELQRNLRIIYNVLEGCDSVLPIWSEPPLINPPFESCELNYEPFVGNKHKINMPDGSNVKRHLVKVMGALQNILLENVEDDTKSLIILAMIWEKLSMNKSRHSYSLSGRRRMFTVSKKNMENKLTGDKGYLPHFLMERVSIQHELRKYRANYAFTETSKNVMLNLFKLCISQYSKCRIKAQSIFWSVLSDYPNSYQVLIPYIVEVLQRDTEIFHDAYKGVLFVLLQNQSNNFLIKSSWQTLSDLLPALVLSKPSEKPSVIRQHDIIISIAKNFTTYNIKLEVPDSCVQVASELWNVGIQPSASVPNQDDIQKGIENLKRRGDKNTLLYNGILSKLLHAMLEKNLHWRHRKMAMNFISSLIHPDHVLPAPIVRYFLNSLIHDSIDERKLAWSVTYYILKQLKKKHPKITIDIPNRENELKPGRRSDNEWLQYKLEKRPNTAKQWDEPRYVHKQYLGYYTWPKKLEVYAPSSEQPTLERNRNLNEQEKEIDTFFSDAKNIDKLINFLTLEEKKGKDRFDYRRYSIFKGLFLNHGDAYLDHLLPHLNSMVQSKQENVQRCAAEIICGIIRGAKYWSYPMTCNMWKSLLPIIRKGLNNITEETIMDWSTCFSLIFKNRDPYKLHWLIECLVEESQIVQLETSFLECSKILLLRNSLNAQAWRLSELFNRLLPRFENRLLQNPFENIRDQLASILVMIFNTNIKFRREDSERNGYPEIDDFMNKMCPRLELLLTEEDSKSVAYVEATRLLITLCCFISKSAAVSHFGAISSFYKLYPLINQLESNKKDNEELSKFCILALGTLAHLFTLPEHVPAALQAVDNASRSASWSARAASVEFLQVFLIHHMSILLSNESWILTIRTIVLMLLQDENVEVREKAARVLTGMIHCTLIPNPQELLEEFKQLAKIRLKNKKNETANIDTANAIRLRHAGVLGMCAFIQAYPYSIPKDIPPIFQYLSVHLSDPEPIPTTIRKTLNDFKRTHCDGWTGLGGLAKDLSEEEFTLLQDLTVSPSYYA